MHKCVEEKSDFGHRDSERLIKLVVLPQMSIVSVDDLVSRPITVMNTIQEAVHVETRMEYSHVLRYVISFNDILIFIAMNECSQWTK